MLAVEREVRAVEAGLGFRRNLPDERHRARIEVQRPVELPDRPAGGVHPRVEGEARVELLPVAVERARKELADSALLLCAQASAVARAAAGGHVAIEVEGGLAGRGVLNQPIGRPVQGIALGQHRVGNQRAFSLGEACATDRRAWSPGVVVLGADDVRRCRQGRRKPGRRPGSHRSRRDSATWPPSCAGRHSSSRRIGAIRSLAVGRRDQRLRHRRELSDRLIAVVQARLRIDAEERRRRLVARVGTDDGKAHVQGIVQAGAAVTAPVAVTTLPSTPPLA